MYACSMTQHFYCFMYTPQKCRHFTSKVIYYKNILPAVIGAEMNADFFFFMKMEPITLDWCS